MKHSAIQTGLITALMLVLSACGGGSSNSPVMTQPVMPPLPPPVATLDPQYLASAASPFVANCDGVAADGVLYTNAEIEPSLAIDPLDTKTFVASWQEDRWSSGGSRGIIVGASHDSGTTWTQQPLAFTRCGGGTPANGGDYERASNAWISMSPGGIAYVAAIAFDGDVLQPGSVSAIVVSRSTDGGASWSATSTLIHDVDNAFNDKVAITADPVTPHFVYAVWDRLATTNTGPSYFARSVNDGVTWEGAKPIYDPGVNNQTINNIPVVLPNGTLIDFYVEIDVGSNNVMTSFFASIRSTDNGATWSGSTKIADNFSVGTVDPDTGAPIRDSSILPQIAVAPSGSLFVVWQDSRFTSGARDSIAFTRSDDGGMTWSAPARVNSEVAVAAFTPTVNVRADGMIGVTYFDFRDNTSDKSTLLTDYWLARSTTGATWQENQIAEPFDLAIAPIGTTAGAHGYFLGDYQALLSVGTTFIPMFAKTNNGNLNNRTDIFVAPAVSVATATVSQKSLTISSSDAMRAFQSSPTWQRHVSENLARTIAERAPHSRSVKPSE